MTFQLNSELQAQDSSWPVYWKENLVVGNLQSNLGIATLWTPKERFLEFFSKDDFAVIGQLYSKDEGINALFRNCLANPNIRFILLLGVDLSNSGQALINLVKNGVDENNNIIGIENSFVDKEIPKDIIELFRKNVEIIDCRKNFDRDFLKNKIREIIKNKNNSQPYSEPLFFPEKKLDENISFPCEKSGFRIEEKSVGEAWLKILQLVQKFGFIKKSQHGEDQKELMNLVAVITDEDPDNIKWKNYFPFSRDDLLQYYPQLVTGMQVIDVSYTYGQRLRSYGSIDQIRKLIDLLKKTPFSRRAISVLYNVNQDIDSENAPCLVLIQCLVQEDKLFMTAYFRSHDLFDGWPKNSFGLLKLQKYICEEVNIERGSLTIISNSAHVYKRNWIKAQEILNNNQNNYKIKIDARGNLRIKINKKENNIEIVHIDTDGNRIDEFKIKNSKEALKKIYCEDKISDISHAIYIGMELMKAEIALKEDLEYIQDKEMEQLLR